jgi:hypothetical protein
MKQIVSPLKTSKARNLCLGGIRFDLKSKIADFMEAVIRRVE